MLGFFDWGLGFPWALEPAAFRPSCVAVTVFPAIVKVPLLFMAESHVRRNLLSAWRGRFGGLQNFHLHLFDFYFRKASFPGAASRDGKAGIINRGVLGPDFASLPGRRKRPLS